MASSLKELVKSNKKYIKEDLDLNEEMDKFLHQEQNRKRKFIPAFHPSLVSKGIDCQLWWFFHLKQVESKKENWSDESLTAMTVGTAIHNEVQHLLYRMGLLEGVYKCITCGHEFWALAPMECPNCSTKFKSWNYLKFLEVPIKTGLIRGHADGLINKDGIRYLLELKSIKNVDRPNAQYGYEVLVNRPLDEHLMQTQLYLNGWSEIVDVAQLGEEYKIDDTGKVSTEKLDSPVYIGAGIIGHINYGIVEYVAKNSSEKRAFLVKRNPTTIKFMKDEMQKIWKGFLEDSIDNLSGVDYNTQGKCKRCVYRSHCKWTPST